ncbi:hypothetical protein [Achromobacter sp. K91]|uniref:hypothetical protein n=1 Tax=Achromobacter sp. K91 TaxID=2292262 RepID=UPI0011C34299|nr:hypothetical protein [Achromobacter sp. K91]
MTGAQFAAPLVPEAGTFAGTLIFVLCRSRFDADFQEGWRCHHLRQILSDLASVSTGDKKPAIAQVIAGFFHGLAASLRRMRKSLIPFQAQIP